MDSQEDSERRTAARFPGKRISVSPGTWWRNVPYPFYLHATRRAKISRGIMSFVFVIGAGASYGERLVSETGGAPPTCKTDATPPVTNGFFKEELFQQIGYSPALAEADFDDAFQYIRWLKQIDKRTTPGSGPWNSIDLEEVFTSIELSREFQGLESDAAARCVLIRNKLIRYVWRIVAYCTSRKYGTYSRKLMQSLPWDTTVITFNYDLLLDQEQIGPEGLRTQYDHFRELALDRESVPINDANGLFLKMHGSLNWFRCTNSTCPFSSAVSIDTNTEGCLNRALGRLCPEAS